MAHNLLRKSESVLVDPCGLALSLAVLLSIQEIPAGFDSPVLIVREFLEIYRQCDYGRAGNFAQIRSLFSDFQLRSLVKDIPKVVLRRGVIRFVRQYARIAVSQLAKEFAFSDYEAEPVICQLKDSRKFHETSMKAILHSSLVKTDADVHRSLPHFCLLRLANFKSVIQYSGSLCIR
jgi:hypothetical protein